MPRSKPSHNADSSGTHPKHPYFNRGCLRFGGELAKDSNTLIICGVARSGTSMAAKLVEGLGIFLGERKDPVVLEDVEMAAALEKDDHRLEQLIEQRNQAHAMWGFKRPSAYKYLLPIMSKFRNPAVIVTMRDLAAISARNVVAIGMDQREALEAALDESIGLLGFLRQLPPALPVLLMSYEKSLLYPGGAAKQLAEFLGIDDPRLIAQAKSSVQKENPAYWGSARKATIQGQVARVKDNRMLIGWAKHPDDSQVTIRVIVNDRDIGQFQADVARPDLVAKNIGHGSYGFAIDVSEHLKAGPNTIVVMDAKTNEELRNSPLNVAVKRHAKVSQ